MIMGKDPSMSQNLLQKPARGEFLKDVLICSLGAYGGPEAHFGVFTEQLVLKKKYLSEEEMLELVALTGILPGPSSTQTIVAIGYKVGGPVLALLTLLVWALPAILIMTLFSFMGQFFKQYEISGESLRFIAPMAVGFILLAAWRLGSKAVKDRLTAVIFLFSAVTTYFIRSFWIFPFVLLSGGVITLLAAGQKAAWNPVKIKPAWSYLASFFGFAAGAYLLRGQQLFFQLFEAFYRYGYLVIGGGQVVVPMMNRELVELNQFLTHEEFMTGFGLVQGVPGPMFSFSAYAGAMAARDLGVWGQTLAGILSGIAIFLPGILLIFFVYPMWNELKQIRAIQFALKGITAAAGGLILSAGLVLLVKNGFVPVYLAVTVATFVILYSKKVPAPWLVLATVLLGWATSL